MKIPKYVDIKTIITMTSSNKNYAPASPTGGRWSAASDSEQEHGGTRHRSLLRRSRRIMGEEFTFPGMFERNQSILQDFGEGSRSGPCQIAFYTVYWITLIIDEIS